MPFRRATHSAAVATRYPGPQRLARFTYVSVDAQPTIPPAKVCSTLPSAQPPTMHSAPAVVLPAQPPKNWSGKFALMPQCCQLQKLPSASVPAAVHTRIGVVPHEVPVSAETKQAEGPVPLYFRSLFVQ